MRSKTCSSVRTGREADEPRYEVCRKCGMSWNVSADLRIADSGYLCPKCAERERQRLPVLAQRLLQCRLRRKVAAYVVSELVGVSRDMVRRYEAGQAIPKADVLAELARYYDVSVDWLLGRCD